MSGPPKSIVTPCIQVCAIDGASGLCLGCYRTLKEVAAWARFSDTERATIMAALPSRRTHIDPAKLAMISGG